MKIRKEGMIHAVNGRQAVMYKDNIEVLHQYWDRLVQEAGLSSLTRGSEKSSFVITTEMGEDSTLSGAEVAQI